MTSIEDNINSDPQNRHQMNGNNEEVVHRSDDNIVSNEEMNSNKKKGHKRGIVYLSYIPIGLNVNKIRQLLSQFGEIDRIYLEKDNKKRSHRKSYNISYSEGWVEFKKKRIAKCVAKTLNGTQIGGKRKNKFYDCIWNIKYLHKFQWSHLAEQMAYEKALRDQRLRFEIRRAKKETNFYSSMIEKSNYIKKHKKTSEDNTSDETFKRNYKQRITDEEIRKSKTFNNELDFELLNKIFK